MATCIVDNTLRLFLARCDPSSSYSHVLKNLSKSENLVDVTLNTYLMATRWDFKLCCAASRLLYDLMCCLEMEQIYAETVSDRQHEKPLAKKPLFTLHTSHIEVHSTVQST